MSEFLQCRRATEAETLRYFQHKDAVYEEAKQLFPDSSKQRFSHVVKRAREIPLIYSQHLNCIVYIPTHEEVFNHWCDANKIPHHAREYVNMGWFGAKRFYETSSYPPDLQEEIARARKMPSEHLRARREKFFSKYKQQTGGRHDISY